jgi:enamine deaminase RidA (YjgF/YER057c/UK114 family)
MSGEAEARLAALGLVLPPPPAPGGFYAPAMRAGGVVHVSGAIGTEFVDGAWRLPLRGALGGAVSLEQGRDSARLCVLNHLAALKALLGDLDAVTQVVKLTGYVHAAPGFTKAPLVLDAASELLVAVFGPERGRHARVAAYQHTMSFDAPLETELLVTVR